jgi:hypothetical protein
MEARAALLLFLCTIFPHLTLLVPATHYQVELTGGPDQVYLSGLADSEWLALTKIASDLVLIQPVF